MVSKLRIDDQDDDDLGGVRGHFGKGNLLDQYPLLPTALGMSAPEETHYMPGDVTVHHGYCAHGSIVNTTDQVRGHIIGHARNNM